MITGRVPAQTTELRAPAFRGLRTLLTSRRTPILTHPTLTPRTVPLGPDTPDVPCALLQPAEDPERMPLYLGHLPEHTRRAAMRLALDLAQAAHPIARVLTPLDYAYHAERQSLFLLDYLAEFEKPAPTVLTPEAYERARDTLEYDGANPFVLRAIVREAEDALSAAEVLALPGPLGEAMRRTQQLAERTRTLTPTPLPPTLYREVTEPLSGWTPPLLSFFFVRDPVLIDTLHELLDEDYQHAMELGEAGATAIFDLRDRTHVTRLTAYQLRAESLRREILAIGNLVLDAGAGMDPTFPGPLGDRA